MMRIIRAGTPQFARFMRELARRRTGGENADIKARVRKIIADVRRRGDRALSELTARFDGVKLGPGGLRAAPKELKAALAGLQASERSTLKLAALRIGNFHRRTLEASFGFRDSAGLRMGLMVRPLARVGIYVPGGVAPYPSSVLMNAMAARAAGVREIAMVSPPARSPRAAAVLMAAAAVAGVSEFYRVGGVQAVAALAYGTETIPAVDKIVGPGNAWVQAAKREVYGVVDIDKIAGPSEVLVIADESARPKWVAADLIAQAEHGSGDESALLITTSSALARETAAALEESMRTLPHGDAVGHVLRRRGAIIVVGRLEEAFEVANRIAPEHLELEIRRPRRWLGRVRAAGAVFLGVQSPAPLGDYLAGPNHVLPTGGTARFASPLGAYDFVVRTSIIQASAAGMKRLGPAAAAFARMEGFEGHARAIDLRLERLRRRMSGAREKAAEKRKTYGVKAQSGRREAR